MIWQGSMTDLIAVLKTFFLTVPFLELKKF